MTKNSIELPKPIISIVELSESVIAVVQDTTITVIKVDYAKMSVSI